MDYGVVGATNSVGELCSFFSCGSQSVRVAATDEHVLIYGAMG